MKYVKMKYVCLPFKMNKFPTVSSPFIFSSALHFVSLPFKRVSRLAVDTQHQCALLLTEKSNGFFSSCVFFCYAVKFSNENQIKIFSQYIYSFRWRAATAFISVCFCWCYVYLWRKAQNYCK